MSAVRKKTASRKTTTHAHGKKRARVSSSDAKASSEETITDHTVYSGFRIYDKRKSPQWHPVKKMRYVFYRMIGGCTITDALKEIHWTAGEFWHLVDLERHAPFREEYKRAKILQGRAFADSVHTIAEGRDKASRRALRRIRKIVEKGLKRAGTQKSALAAKMIVEGLVNTLGENDKAIIARNKLQIDAAKWIAKTANPNEYTEGSKLSLGNSADGESGAVRPILIQFVGPDGKVVSL